MTVTALAPTILSELSEKLQGSLFTDTVMRTLYATDASAYREMPLGVAIPETIEDIQTLISFADSHQIPLIPRTAGTSLAGQVVGSGLVVDVSKYFNRILEINKEESYVWVEPGVVRDVLNEELKKQGAQDIIVFVGGVIPKQDYEFLYASGVKGICGPGTPIPVSARDVLKHIEQAVQAQK